MMVITFIPHHAHSFITTGTNAPLALFHTPTHTHTHTCCSRTDTRRPSSAWPAARRASHARMLYLLAHTPHTAAQVAAQTGQSGSAGDQTGPDSAVSAGGRSAVTVGAGERLG